MSTPFVVASGGSASSSSLTLNVAQTTSNGDSLKIGIAINHASAVFPEVTDSQGNNWTATLTDVIETGAQLWVFEAPGAAELVAGTDTITITVNSS